jgi:flagellar motor switch protein FliN/FliY
MSPIDGVPQPEEEKAPISPESKVQAQQPVDEISNMDLLMDISLKVAVELGRTRMTLHQVLELQNGSVIELDRLAGDPVDIFINDRLIAHGELVVVDDKFGVRITELISPSSRSKS